MQALFEHADAEEYTANAVELDVILRKCQQDHTTGAVQVASPQRGVLQFLFSRGEVVSILAQTGTDDVRANGDSWNSVLAAGDTARVRVMRLPPLALRLTRLLAESGEHAEMERVETSRLGPLLESWRRPQSPSVLHLAWRDAEGILVLPQTGEVIRDTLFLSDSNSVLVGQEAQDGIFARADGSCVARIFPSQADSQAWLDYSLHYVFVSLSERFIERYEQFTGRILVNAIARDVAITAEREDWDISMRATKIEDQTFCRTPAQAALIYRELLNIIRHHMTVVLGSKLVNSIIVDTLAEIPLPYNELVQDHGLLPEIFVSAGLGRS